MRIGPRRSAEAALKSGLDRLTPRVVGVAFFEDRVLLTRHGNTGWELPGGRKIRGERNRACIVRWFAEQLGIEVVVGGPMGISGFAGPDGWKPFVASGCRLPNADGLRVPDGYEDARLFALGELDTLHLEKAYRDFIDRWTPEIAAGGLPKKPPEY